ncbi:zinc-ribbon domain containing protein [Paucibacter sp. DJ2R-2]|uniref:zinc-ribbon domain containing protein n=1 Tax=Paucibacter sp. DJ2R-2 TaxID=2893558 RepID=UPI0021E4C965|nr:zinc-ribbon domain containing protein [Paucibacter sp. DJ2R-2]MCV2423807.1 zinc-ribbon domain containing protein [Paucibacter sp. DJ4R-1]MCV2441523.1 zinc-ribbon domain containing protein [Paucibacter sp. DJ2R-2]
MPKKSPSIAVSADPSKWSEASQRSVSAEWTSEYTDILYSCWHCKAESVFSAQDQKYTFEEKKAPIDQRRLLCQACWAESHRIAARLKEFDTRWAEQKQSLRTDKEFAAGWLETLELQERYVPYRHDVARKNMLRKLLGDA